MIESLETHIFLVIPCYRESRRLPPFLEPLCVVLAALPFRVTLQLADDGSGADERDRLRTLVDSSRERFPELVAPLLEFSHEGKGGTLLRAWSAAPAGVTHYAFTDADGAVSPEEVGRVLRELVGDTSRPPETCVFAVRRMTAHTSISRNPVRRLLGLCYYRLVRFLLDSTVYDPACGFKVLSRAFWDTCGHLLTEREWALDIEILARIEHHGFPLWEIPVSWEEKSGSKLSRADFSRTLKQAIAIQRRSLDWDREAVAEASGHER